MNRTIQLVGPHGELTRTRTIMRDGKLIEQECYRRMRSAIPFELVWTDWKDVKPISEEA